MGKEYIRRVMPKRAVLIGDTLHDKEVADALGVDCILVANGHQSKEVLLSCDVTVINRRMDVAKFLNVANTSALYITNGGFAAKRSVNEI